MDRPPLPRLQPLELLLLGQLARGRTVGQAAAELHYTEGYLRQILVETRRKLGAKNSTQAVAVALRLNLI